MKIEKYTPTKIRNLKMMIYGESGVGKTVLASTFPQPLFLDIDDGMISIQGREVFRIRITQPNEMMDAITWIITNPEKLQSIETIVVDSLNELQSIWLKNVLDEYPVKRPYDTLPAQTDYSKMLFDVENIVRALLLLDKHILFIAQAANRAFEDESIQPALIGKTSAKLIVAKLDLIGYMRKLESGRVLFFDYAGAVTKDRLNVFPKSILDPTWDKLESFIRTRKE